MRKIDVCIEPLFPGLSSLEKVKKATQIGFNAFEFWFWDHEFNGKDLISVEKDINEIASFVFDNDCIISNIVINSPDGCLGGSLTNKKDNNIYLSRLEKTIEVAHKLRCRNIITCTGNLLENTTIEEQRDSICTILERAVDITAKAGMSLLLEALNSTIDHPGYYLTSSKLGFDIINRINHPNLKLLFDIYHMQIMEGNLINNIQKNIHSIGHFHSASLPGRNEIYTGEINYSYILNSLEDFGYDDYFGLEYWPKGDTEKSLKTTLAYLESLQPVNN